MSEKLETRPDMAAEGLLQAVRDADPADVRVDRMSADTYCLAVDGRAFYVHAPDRDAAVRLSQVYGRQLRANGSGGAAPRETDGVEVLRSRKPAGGMALGRDGRDALTLLVGGMRFRFAMVGDGPSGLRLSEAPPDNRLT